MANMSDIKKYVIVGAGGRGSFSYAEPIVKEFGDCAALCGVYDLNKKRAAHLSKIVGKDIPVYDSFEEMVKDVKPYGVIVTTMDANHDEYVIKALSMGCNVICEKPMTTTAEKCKAIFEAQSKYNKDVFVTFNLRFDPFFSSIKDIVMQGHLGKILSVHYEWALDTVHGADYFRRWHRERKNSGSLLIHKSTHHFDIANWLIGQSPIKVNAFGTQSFYGPKRENRSERCIDCPYKKTCEFYFDIEENPRIKEMYRDCEDADGYFRDRCVFSEKIDIEDTVSVSVMYDGGAVMSYSLTAHSPYEGFRIVLNGEKGRLIAERFDGGIGVYKGRNEKNIRLYNRHGDEIIYNVNTNLKGGHGGADPLMLEMLIRGGLEDPQGKLADITAGTMSIGIGIAANKSMKENRMVELKEFFDYIDTYK